MILNTKIIHEQINIKDTSKENINPLKIKQDLQEAANNQKEADLQARVATIFKDKKYYKNFQETALQQVKTPEQIAQEKEEKEKARQDKLVLGKTAASAVGNAFGYALPNTIVGLGIKGLGWAGEKIGQGIHNLMT